MPTDPHLAKFISSQQMEVSEIQEQVISLGKALVQELGLEPSVDTLSRWMAHYVAEQIEVAEKAKGSAKARAEQRCFDTVLKLWERHSSWPLGRRPFENFEPIFRALDKLDPEKPEPFYFRSPWLDSSESSEDSESESTDVKSWIDIALGVDGTARVFIEYAFMQAANSAVDEKTIEWLNLTANLHDNSERSVIASLLSSDEDRPNQERAASLQKRVEKLDAFLALGEELRQTFIEEIEKTKE